MKLYYAPGACSLAPHIALEEIGARFELSRVELSTNQQNSAEYLRVNPKARVPALSDGGWTLTEVQQSFATLRRAIRPPGFGHGIRARRCAAPNGLAGYRQRFMSPLRMCGAARYAADPRAVEDVAATAKKTCREFWQAVDVKIGEGPGRSASATASPILICSFTRRGDAGLFSPSTWRMTSRIGRRTRGV
jgi:glutathione S-transferase